MNNILKEIYQNIDEKTIMKEDKRYVMNTYNRLPIVPIRGQGIYLEDINGKKYLDFLSGIGVNNIGHCNPKLIGAVK